MTIREQLQDGVGRKAATVIIPIGVAIFCYERWPDNSSVQDKILGGFQKIAFVAAAFAITAYNLRTRVVDMVLKMDGKPSRIEDFCRIEI